jgi:hypothetical protein
MKQISVNYLSVLVQKGKTLFRMYVNDQYRFEQIASTFDLFILDMQKTDSNFKTLQLAKLKEAFISTQICTTVNMLTVKQMHQCTHC